MDSKRSSFTGKIGFILAAAGSAVGLGNIWRFPYLAAQYGGGIFLLVYFILAITFGFTLMCAEISLGRKTGQSAIGAFGALSKKHSYIGLLAALVPTLILPYYSVIGGWVTKYLAVFISGKVEAAAVITDDFNYFTNFISQPIEPIGWFLLFLGITAFVVMLGVEKGIEKVSKVLMPVLVVLTFGIAVYTLFLPGALDGLRYYLIPDFSKFSFKTVIAAMGQMFYSMSLAMGIMITYGSYMKKDVSIESSVKSIELFDTGVAFFAGLMIIPAVFSFNPEHITKSGPGLMFEVLPQVFNNLGVAGGTVIGSLFFLLVLLAALTSSISLMETVVSIFQDKFGWGRKFTSLFVFIISVALGLPSALGYGLLANVQIAGMAFLDMFDFISNSILMPIVALLTCYFIGYAIKPKTLADEIAGNNKFSRRGMFHIMIKYIAPICIMLILISSILSTLGIKQFQL